MLLTKIFSDNCAVFLMVAISAALAISFVDCSPKRIVSDLQNHGTNDKPKIVGKMGHIDPSLTYEHKSIDADNTDTPNSKYKPIKRRFKRGRLLDGPLYKKDKIKGFTFEQLPECPYTYEAHKKMCEDRDLKCDYSYKDR